MENSWDVIKKRTLRLICMRVLETPSAPREREAISPSGAHVSRFRLGSLQIPRDDVDSRAREPGVGAVSTWWFCRFVDLGAAHTRETGAGSMNIINKQRPEEGSA